MDKDFMQYVYARVEKALMENAEYLELQEKFADAGRDILIQNKDYDELSGHMACMEQELCYKQGYQDGLRAALLALKGA